MPSTLRPDQSATELTRGGCGDFTHLETGGAAAESLNLYHLGSVERVGAAARQGSAGVTPLREAAWLIELYIRCSRSG
jgi:hypothetical protein